MVMLLSKLAANAAAADDEMTTMTMTMTRIMIVVVCKGVCRVSHIVT